MHQNNRIKNNQKERRPPKNGLRGWNVLKGDAGQTLAFHATLHSVCVDLSSSTRSLPSQAATNGFPRSSASRPCAVSHMGLLPSLCSQASPSSPPAANRAAGVSGYVQTCTCHRRLSSPKAAGRSETPSAGASVVYVVYSVRSRGIELFFRNLRPYAANTHHCPSMVVSKIFKATTAWNPLKATALNALKEHMRTNVRINIQDLVKIVE